MGSAGRGASLRVALALLVALAVLANRTDDDDTDDSAGAGATGALAAHEKVLCEMPVPAGNPQTADKVELGRLLFFDNRLSGNNQMSCATCHNPDLG